jgi:hypothetical protein
MPNTGWERVLSASQRRIETEFAKRARNCSEFDSDPNDTVSDVYCPYAADLAGFNTARQSSAPV